MCICLFLACHLLSLYQRASGGRGMKVGITVWGKRISPVFDAARTLLIVEVEQNQLAGRQFLQLWPEQIEDVVHLLCKTGVEVLICGAISQEPAKYIETSGIHLIPFIAGRAEQVLEWYAKGSSITGYRMPGCHGNGSGRGRRCRGFRECGIDSGSNTLRKK